MIRTRFHHDARAELAAAAKWYEQRRPGLGLDFVAAVNEATSIIALNPEAWPRCSPARLNVRRFLMPRFPYAVVYAVRDVDVLVVAVAHRSRKPNYWLARVRRHRVGRRARARIPKGSSPPGRLRN